MKRLLFIALWCVLAGSASAQTPVALAPVPKPVFTQNGAPLVGGCLSTFSAGTTTPLASYTDSSGSVANSNPIILDANGSPTNAIYLSAAAYKFQLKSAGGSNCSSGSTVWTADNVSAAAFLNLPNTWTALQTFSAGIVANTLTIGRLDGIRFVDGTLLTTVQQAINDLPTGATGGGIVYIPPGSYACPTSLPKGVVLINSFGWGVPTAPPQIWSKFNGAAFQSFSAGTGSQNMVLFTGCTLNLTDVSQVGILGIVLDYGNTANMTIKGVSWSQFAMAVVNVPTTLIAVNYIGDVTNAFNSQNNKFYYLVTEGGNVGLSVGTATGNAATVGEFDWVLNLVDAQPAGAYTGIAWVGQCDSNRVHRHSVFTTNVITNFKGEVFNSGTPTVDDDADSIIVDLYEETMNGSPATSTSIVMNQSKGNIFTTGVTQSNTQLTVLQPTTTTYTWHETGQIVGTPNVEVASIFQAITSVLAKRITVQGGTNLITGNFALSGGWGSGPAGSVTTIKGTDAAFVLTVTSGGGVPTANPTAILTFADGAWSFAPVCTVSRNDGSAPAGAYWAQTVSTTQLTLTFVGTPGTATAYGASVICMGKPN